MVRCAWCMRCALQGVLGGIKPSLLRCNLGSCGDHMGLGKVTRPSSSCGSWFSMLLLSLTCFWFCTIFEDLRLFQHDGGTKAQIKHVNFTFAPGSLVSEKSGWTELRKLPAAEPSYVGKNHAHIWSIHPLSDPCMSNQCLHLGSGLYIHFRDPCHNPSGLQPSDTDFHTSKFQALCKVICLRVCGGMFRNYLACAEQQCYSYLLDLFY